MDPFEVRMQFLALLRRLNASQDSIQKVVGFALKFFSSCGEDLWDCVVEASQKGSINNRINILYFLDSLCESSLLAKSHPAAPTNAAGTSSLYVDYVARDLGKIVASVVPEGRHGLPNLMSTKQILENWRSKRVIDPQKVDDILATLNDRGDMPVSADPPSPTLHTAVPTTSAVLSRNEVFKRIEEDRERHKRLRERRWVQPVAPHTLASALPPPLATFMPLPGETGHDAHGRDSGAAGWARGEELTIDIEFENEWETTSDWNEDDDDAIGEENELCFLAEKENPAR